jgi:amino acid permease
MNMFIDISLHTHTHTHTHAQVLVFFIIATLLILAYAAEIKQVSTYESIVEQVCGPFFKILAELCIVVFCFGCATTFLVVIGDQAVDSESNPAHY